MAKNTQPFDAQAEVNELVEKGLKPLMSLENSTKNKWILLSLKPLLLPLINTVF